MHPHSPCCSLSSITGYPVSPGSCISCITHTGCGPCAVPCSCAVSWPPSPAPLRQTTLFLFKFAPGFPQHLTEFWGGATGRWSCCHRAPAVPGPELASGSELVTRSKAQHPLNLGEGQEKMKWLVQDSLLGAGCQCRHLVLALLYV